MKTLLLISTFFLWAGGTDSSPACDILIGRLGRSAEWGAGWLDVASPVDLQAGDTLRFTIGGSARRVAVRLLPKGAAPDSPTGVIGSHVVPTSRVLELVIANAVRQVVQLSVHGSARPWGAFEFGPTNGPATLLRVERCHP